ncbi:WD40-repeat-containing domain protein [Fusarium flagelliforme]|uniref:WD40-repeat-containing domain protein n=1 Tax=Fusarium flagelliforme TaxID=2675880 RepID=UPI001E8D80AC|nr:WD40-repeat-containing domain protein [Fusarium flagelliforme]KAH7198618.1 WD40-repeat-containing domain protein [Fusarium flagelliforme]
MAIAHDPFELPKLRSSFILENDTEFLENDNVAEFFDVKFCPYQPLDAAPVFAAISKKHVVICTLSQTTDGNPCEILSVIRDDDEEASACCCTWTKDPETGAPYLCIGGVDAKVKIYDVVNGKLYRATEVFVHPPNPYISNSETYAKQDVNDLATSPADPCIIASASGDTSIRVWSLDPVHANRPCLVILSGEGHSWDLLSLAFHDTGRYLLSAGHDQVINLWTIPELPTEAIQTPARIHYPHFSTSAVHSGIIDCVAFYGDCIISRACHDNVISLWRIEGFSSSNPPPAESEAPVAQTTIPSNCEEASRLTLSAFVPTVSPQCPSQYTTLLQFATPNCGPQFFMRFKLHFVPDQHPVLAFCNAGGNVFFWDFERLVAYREFMEAYKDPGRDKSKQLPHPSWLRPVKARPKQETGKGRHGGGDKDIPSTFKEDAIRLSEEIDGYNAETLETWASRYSTGDPHEPLKAHKTESSSATFVGRQTAWSPGAMGQQGLNI